MTSWLLPLQQSGRKVESESHHTRNDQLPWYRPNVPARKRGKFIKCLNIMVGTVWLVISYPCLTVKVSNMGPWMEESPCRMSNSRNTIQLEEHI